MKRKECLNEAERLTYGERNEAYGSPIPSLGNIARLWSNYKVCPNCGKDVPFWPHDVGLMMCLLKISRLRKDFSHKDGYIDTAGWAACAVETLEGPDYVYKWVGKDEDEDDD